MTSWLDTLAQRVALHGALVRLTVIRAEGSTPREAGAAMLVTAEGIEGTIGGGALELEAIAAARAMLKSRLVAGLEPAIKSPSIESPALWMRETRDFPLGPSLGQCCGGYAKVLFEAFTRAEISLLHASLDRDSEAGLAVRPLENGPPLRLLIGRKEGYADLPLNVLCITRDMLSGARPSGVALVSATKGASAWFIEPVSREKTPLYLYGAGHVGRALVRVLDGLPFQVIWVDTSEERFPPGGAFVDSLTFAGSEASPPHPALLPEGRRDDRSEPQEMRGSSPTQIATQDPAAIALCAPEGAFHLVMTYSHPLDLAICHAILKSARSGFLGLIGSTTKRARFIKRLRELGHDKKAIAHLTCPIGITGLPGKEPATIAVSVAAQLLQMAAAAKSARPAIEAGEGLR